MMQLVVGLGMSGIGAALTLQEMGENWTAVEAELQPGGWARSKEISAYRLDFGPHIMLDFGDELFQWMGQLDDIVYRKHSSKSVFFCEVGGRPFPVHLPLEENISTLPDVFRTPSGLHSAQETSYTTHLLQTFGSAIASHFLIPYDEKRLCVDLETLPPKWNHRVLPKGKVKVGESSYYYPVDAGIGDLTKELVHRLDQNRVKQGLSLVRLSLSKKVAWFSDGSSGEFNSLYSSIPLPAFLDLIEDFSFDIQKARAALPYAHSELTYLAVKGNWTKDYDFARFAPKELNFHRLTVLSNYADNCCPKDEILVVVETNYPPSIGNRVASRADPEMMLKQLIDLGIFPPKTKCSFSHSEFVEYSAIFSNAQTPDLLSKVSAVLEDASVHLIGKFGRWEDMLMGRALTSGIQSVEQNYKD